MLNNFLGRFFRKAQTIFGARVKNGLFIKKRCIKSLYVVSFQTKSKTCGILWSVWFCSTKYMRPVSDNFLYVDIWFNVAMCIFIVKNSSLLCWLCFRLFLWRTKNNFGLWFRNSFKRLLKRYLIQWKGNWKSIYIGFQKPEGTEYSQTHNVIPKRKLSNKYKKQCSINF